VLQAYPELKLNMPGNRRNLGIKNIEHGGISMTFSFIEMILILKPPISLAIVT